MCVISTGDNGVYVAAKIKVLDQYRSDWDKDPGQRRRHVMETVEDSRGRTGVSGGCSVPTLKSGVNKEGVKSIRQELSAGGCDGGRDENFRKTKKLKIKTLKQPC